MPSILTEIPFWLTPATSLFAAIVGGFIVHLSSFRREKAAKKRELLVKGKLELWNLLDNNNGVAADAVGDRSVDPNSWEEITRNLQLYGTDEQMELWKKVVKISPDTDTGPFARLMKSLQNDVRAEVGMATSDVPYFWVRMKSQSTANLEENK